MTFYKADSSTGQVTPVDATIVTIGGSLAFVNEADAKQQLKATLSASVALLQSELTKAQAILDGVNKVSA